MSTLIHQMELTYVKIWYMTLTGQSKIASEVATIGVIFMPLNVYDLLAIFITKFFGVSDTISKCKDKFLGAGAFLWLTTFQLNLALLTSVIAIM